MASEQNYFVAVAEDGTFVGMLSGSAHDERGGHWMFGMFVRPDYRGRGVADQLVDAVANWATSDGGVTLNLYVTRTVDRANAFYRRLGFSTTGETVTMDRDQSIVLDHMRLPLGPLEIRQIPAVRLHDLRRRVLRGNDPAADAGDPRDDDADALHVAGLINDVVVVSSSWYPSTPPVNKDLATYQLRYMATSEELQGLGYGALVLNAAERELRERGALQLWANGRDTALGFYRATGWEILPGSEHVSPYTGLPHTVIYKVL
jgi:GNAT superfamily N-acetyltransferase